MPFLIDGYNLLRSVQRLDGFAELTDAQLCRCVADFLRAVRQRGTVVFDGIGPPDKRELMGVKGLDICFSGERTDADTIIEQRIAASTAPKHLIVVSSDRRLRTAATRRKAKSVTVDVFWPGLCKTIENSDKLASEPREKQKGITELETEVWMEYFKFHG